MRRLPVYVLLDTSGSMSGEPNEIVKNGVQLMISTLQSDPYALETAHVSFITFDSDVKQVTPLTEVGDLQMPVIGASGGTELGRALQFLCKCIDNEVQKNSGDQKGDWKPAVFIMTDGEPTDDYRGGLAQLKTYKFSNIVACAAGHSVNTNVLHDITENVVQLDTMDAATMKSFFKWVSASISTMSVKVESGTEDVSTLDALPPLPDGIEIV